MVEKDDLGLQNLKEGFQISHIHCPRVSCCFAGEEAPFSAILHSGIVVAISTAGRLLAIVVLEQLLVVGFKCDGKQDTRVMLHETSLVVYNV